MNAGETKLNDNPSKSLKRKREDNADEEPFFFIAPPHPPSQTWCSTTRNPPNFYDNLSKIHLTSGAVEVFNRRYPPVANSSAKPIEPEKVRAFQNSTDQPSADLKRFARTGGPDLSDVRGCDEPESFIMPRQNPDRAARKPRDEQESFIMPQQTPNRVVKQRRGKRGSQKSNDRSNTTKEDKNTKSSGKTNAYNENFMVHLKDGYVFGPQRDPKPTNLTRLKEKLARFRKDVTTTTITDEVFEAYLVAHDALRNEPGTDHFVLPFIEGVTKEPYSIQQSCTNWAPLIPVADPEEPDVVISELVIPQPDHFHGTNYHPKHAILRKHLNTLIFPTKGDGPFLPNFFVEIKGPGGKLEVATRQATYDGALGARAMHHIRKIDSRTPPNEKAYAFSATYYMGNLELYAHHVAPSTGSPSGLAYHMTSIGTWQLRKSASEFREAAAAFRNLRAHAKKVRSKYIDKTVATLRSMEQ